MASDNIQERGRIHFLVAVLLASATAAFLMQQTMTFRAEFSDVAASPPARVDGYTKITIDFGDGTKRAFRGRTETGMTAMVILRAAQAAGGFRVETDERGAILAIHVTRSDDTHVWRLYRNGVFARDVFGRVTVDPGDTLLLRY